MKIINGNEELTAYVKKIGWTPVPMYGSSALVFTNCLIKNVNSFPDSTIAFDRCVLDSCSIGDIDCIVVGESLLLKNCECSGRTYLRFYKYNNSNSKLTVVGCSLPVLSFHDYMDATFFNTTISAISSNHYDAKISFYNSKIQEFVFDYVTTKSKKIKLQNTEIKALLWEGGRTSQHLALQSLQWYIGVAKRIVLIDCIFIDMKFENLNLNDFDFSRCYFNNCKVTGCDFSRCGSAANYEVVHRNVMISNEGKPDIVFLRDSSLSGNYFGRAEVKTEEGQYEWVKVNFNQE